MTPEEIARVNQQIPGFAGMSPQQQQDILNRLGLRNAQTSTVQQQPKPTTSQQVQGIAPAIGAQAGYQALTAQAPATGYAASGSLTASGAVPAAGSAGTASATTVGMGNPGIGGIAAGGYTGYQQIKGGSNLIQGKPVSNIQHAALYPITGGFDTIVAKTGLSKVLGLGGKKDKDQQNRDQDRATLKAGGVLDDQYNLTLSDGSKVNLGLDGSVKNYNVDFNEKGIGDVVALVNPFAYLVTGGDVKRASDLAGQLTNAFKGSKDPLAETKALFEKAGLFKEDALSRIDQLKVDDQTKNIFKATINKLGLQSVPGTATQTAAPSGGFKIVVNQVKAPTPKPVDNRPAIRNSILQNMLQQNTQPLQYPRQDPNYKNQNFNGTLQKLVGI